MNTLAPITLKLYNDADEEIGELKRTRIPSYLLDSAIRVQSSLGKTATGQEEMDAVFDFIVEFYQHKVEREELKKQTDLIECMSVLKAILGRAGNLAKEFAQENPQHPSPKPISTEMGTGTGT
jgi:hypothetical protein